MTCQTYLELAPASPRSYIWPIRLVDWSAAATTLKPNESTGLGSVGTRLQSRSPLDHGRAYSVRQQRTSARALTAEISLIPPAAPLQIVSKFALRELLSRDIKLLLIDEADAWSSDSLRGLISLYDGASQSGNPISATLAGGPGLGKWLAELASGLSRTIRIEEFSPLPLELVMATLKRWDTRFATVAEELSAGTKEARRVAAAITRICGGNLRRLSFFTKLLQMHYPECKITIDTVEAVGEHLLHVD